MASKRGSDRSLDVVEMRHINPDVPFLFPVGGAMEGLNQPRLFWSELHVRSWCGHTWMTRVWRRWDGDFVCEEKLNFEEIERNGTTEEKTTQKGGVEGLPQD